MTTQHFVCTGGPADGRLVPGDQLVKINNVAVDDLTPEQAAEIIRLCIEKRAKLRSNPVKVHFAEEVEVNGHSQGNSLLFLPNVLKVYLENGQTKAFKFEPSTTVKDIVMTLKEKLSLSHIEHFSLVLEQRHSISKLLLLHDEERIQEVVQKKEAHDYRCLFRVCFMPKSLESLLQEDPTAFEYLYLQGVNDVLQERFAIEMRCNTALRLAALHIQERLASCGQSPKTNLKIITKTWGIENFVSSTLLRNMREKDLRKAIGYHMKKSQLQHDPKQKGLSVDQTRINYLQELAELRSFGGKSFSATMMLQDRESMVTLLVGAQYGVSQVVNHKLSVLSTLTEFTSITRIELLPESEKVSLVKIYLQDIKPITLLLESVAAKDMSCLIAGYCRVFVDPSLNIFPWIDESKKHRVSAEEGKGKYTEICSEAMNEETEHKEETESAQEGVRIQIEVTNNTSREKHGIVGKDGKGGDGEMVQAAEEQPSASETSDSCHTDSRVLTSPSSDSLDALEEDDLLSCSSTSGYPRAEIHPHIHSHRHVHSHLLAPPTVHSHRLKHLTNYDRGEGDCRRSGDGSDARCYYNLCSNITPDSARSLPHLLHHSQGGEPDEMKEDDAKAGDLEPVPILQPPPGFGDSSSDEEFFDARDRFTSPEDPTSGAVPRDGEKAGEADRDKQEDEDEGGGRETLLQLRKRSRKRRSFMESDYTSMVSYPEPDPEKVKQNRIHKSLLANNAQMLISDPEPSGQTQNPSPTVSSLTHSEGEPAQLESKPILSRSHSHGQTNDTPPASRTKKQDMEMEPDAMEFKSVTDLVKAAPPTITVVRCRVDPDGKESADRRGDGKEEGEGQEERNEGRGEDEKDDRTGVSGNGPFTSHMFFPEVEEEGKGEDKGGERIEGVRGNSSERDLKGPESQSEVNTTPPCLIALNKKGSNGFLASHLIASELNSNEERRMIKGVHDKSNSLSSPPPPPPSSPLPVVPVIHKSQSDEELRTDLETSTKISSSICEEMPQNHTRKVPVTTSVNEDEAVGIVCSTLTTSDDVTDSTNSDNVFDDDEVTNSLNPSSSGMKDDWNLATKCSIRSNSATAGEAQIALKSLKSAEPHARIHSANIDYTLAINSITAKLGAATSISSPTFNSGTRLKSEVTQENTSCLLEPRNDSTMPSVEVKECVARSSLVRTNDISKGPPSPNRFLFQPCSPSIMGRLSASTLRGKIQQLPLYLSCSYETLHQDETENVAEGNCSNNVETTIQVTDVTEDVTQTTDFETGTNAETVDSDDSDTTVTGSEVDGELLVEITSEKSFNSPLEMKEANAPVQTEPKAQYQTPLLYSPVQNTPGPITEPPAAIVNSIQRDTSGLKIDTTSPVKDALNPTGDSPAYKLNSPSLSNLAPIVVTTQSLNRPGLPFHDQSQGVRCTSNDRPLIGLCRPSEQLSDSPKDLSSGCRVFTICEGPSQSTAPAEDGAPPPLKPEIGCSSVLASGCESVMEGVQVPLDACGCPAIYTNCFSSGDSFDEELTVYEFSCRTQSSMTQTSGAGLPVMTSPPAPSFLSTSSTLSPSFPRSILFSSSTSELSPLLSPLTDTSDCFLSQTHKDTISRLGQQRYPGPPTGFQVLRLDVDQLLSILEGSSSERAMGQGGRHPRDTCPAHFTENKRVLQIEARRLMSGCQKVVGIGQSPEEMLDSLADSFRTLVELAGICLWFSGCDRCDRRNAEAVAGLADVARSFRDFCLAAERTSSKRSCQDLSIKLLAKQCTALTASVFCLTQLFRTLTAL
uniref:FERM and PDZ domain containing 1b n=1 Tax=Echeneis naucrates TaxID=173247 RepID=A0A665UNM7_ECHNA